MVGWVALWGAGLVSLPLQAQWTLRSEAGVQYDSNPGNAADREATVPVTGLFAAFEAGRTAYLTDRLSLRGGAHVRGELFNRAEGLNEVQLGLDGAFRQKWGLGTRAPWTEFALSGSREETKDAPRRAWLGRGALRAGARVAESLRAQAELWAERRSAHESAREESDLSGDAFSRRTRGYTLGIEAELGERLTFSLAYLHRRGDVTLSSLEEADDYPQAKAAALDPTFGAAFFAYRVEGTSHGGRAALAFALTSTSALVLSLERQVTTIEGGEVYGRDLSTLAYKVAF
jgi:hypothetical protein